MSIRFTKVKTMDEKKNASAYKAGIRAFVDIQLNDTIEVNGFRVLDNGNGLWVAPPSNPSTYKDRKGKEVTTYHPVFTFSKQEHNNQLSEDIIKQYKAVLNGTTSEEKKTIEAIY